MRALLESFFFTVMEKWHWKGVLRNVKFKPEVHAEVDS